jgi:ectonucleotide pyrophosphatase/phosphodiesterase family protein 6
MIFDAFLCKDLQFERKKKQHVRFISITASQLTLGIYLEVLDLFGHRYGANSVQLNNMLSEVDETLHDFRRNLSSFGLQDDVNIMIFSDHGMMNISKIVNITDILNISDIKIILPEPSIATIWPVEGQIEKV